MARQSNIYRQKKRETLSARHYKSRKKLTKIVKDATVEFSEKLSVVVKLQKRRRDESPTRSRPRCAITGRPRGNTRFFGISRTVLREAALSGRIPGVRKGS